MEIPIHSTSGKVVGHRYKTDKSAPGQRCITYSDYEPSEIKKQAKKAKSK